MENLLPWQGQLMVPPPTEPTEQPWWVQVLENALKSPELGWVTTHFWSANTAPPPSGMSLVWANASPPPASWTALLPARSATAA